ncbi:hypothetical protein R3W88_014814 [Solanum pinnatisectum]|uniref:Meiosis-specific protein ASY3-like coiled-coil domain-containing protein n=1 Tax=Solanum pinnatisectum TaxID=50273 RepID=A0AAV9KTB6_9SOLN|nr:hypothetical protein R3W88_014814 [Solanum pinnatisectum]
MLRKLDLETPLFCSCQDLAGDAWSFGSNYHQSSQSRKIKAEDQTHLAAVKIYRKEISIDDGTTMAQKTSSKGNFTNEKNKKELANTSAIRNQRESTEKQTSPLISTKTIHHKPTSEVDTQVDKPSIAQGVVEMCNTSHRVEVGPAKCSLRSFLTQTMTLQGANMNPRLLCKTCLTKKSKEKLPKQEIQAMHLQD